jgi:hypothetical protein
LNHVEVTPELLDPINVHTKSTTFPEHNNSAHQIHAGIHATGLTILSKVGLVVHRALRRFIKSRVYLFLPPSSSTSAAGPAANGDGTGDLLLPLGAGPSSASVSQLSVTSSDLVREGACAEKYNKWQKPLRSVIHCVLDGKLHQRGQELQGAESSKIVP